MVYYVLCAGCLGLDLAFDYTALKVLAGVLLAGLTKVLGADLWDDTRCWLSRENSGNQLRIGGTAEVGRGNSTCCEPRGSG